MYTSTTQSSTETQSHTNSAQPPSFQPVNSIELVSIESSKIAAVSVYSGRAEITRVFKFEVKTGQNQVAISGLPSILDQDSLRVEGRGAATIHDVTVSNIRSQSSETSSVIKELESRKEKTTKALERCKKAISSLESYLGTMDVKTVDVGHVRQVVKEYDTTAEELDNRVLELEGQLKVIDTEIEKESSSLYRLQPKNKLRKRVDIGVFADVEGEVEIVLIYAVLGASWTAGYDIRVNTHTYEEPVTLIYKASITQNMGEDWTDVPLTLETATPTFGLNLPKLKPWNLSIYKPIPPLPPHALKSRTLEPAFMALPPAISMNESIQASRYADVAPEMSHRGLDVVPSTGMGNVSATFQVPGLITIPSDGAAHNVTIVKLSLDAVMSWVCVPKKDVKVHLSANIKNASQYTLLRGTASVYVDRSFISRSEVPDVSPEESFDCPLGLDPSIRITYHPLSRKKSESGFYTKTTTHVYTQSITVFNTKSTPVERVRVSDQIPVSEDAQIQVRLLSPPLPSVAHAYKGQDKDKGKERVTDEGAEKRVVVSKGVSAMWEGGEEGEGRNGKLCWVVGLPGQGKASLVLQYEVVVPAGANVVGLEATSSKIAVEDENSVLNVIFESATTYLSMEDNSDPEGSELTVRGKTLYRSLLTAFLNITMCKRLLDVRGEMAQVLIDAIQRMLDDKIVALPLKNNFIFALAALVSQSNMYPRRFILHGVIGRGGKIVRVWPFTTTITVGSLGGKAVCIKTLEDKKRERNWLQKMVLWAQLSHPNVLSFSGICLSDDGYDSPGLVSPYLKDEDIVTFLERYPHANRQALISDVAAGMFYLHDNGLVHGNIEELNVLVTFTTFESPRACLTGFGSMTIAGPQNDVPNPSSWAVVYPAPELLETFPHRYLTQASDVYAFAVTSYLILVVEDDELLGWNGNLREVIPEVERSIELVGHYIHDELDDLMWKLLLDCSSQDPAIRPTACHIVERLKKEEDRRITHLDGTDTEGPDVDDYKFFRKYGAPFLYNHNMQTADDVFAFFMTSYWIFTYINFARWYNSFDNMLADSEHKRPVKPIGNAFYGLDDFMWRLLEDCWASDPSIRPNAHQIVHRLEEEKQSRTSEKREKVESMLNTIFTNTLFYKRLLSTDGIDAQILIDGFQLLLDTNSFQNRGQLVAALRRLSAQTEQYPSRFSLVGPVSTVEDMPFASGSCADIFKVSLQGVETCFKVIRVSQRSLIEHMTKVYAREVILWGQLSHPNILPFYGLSKFRSQLAFVTSWATNGNLSEYLTRSPGVNRLLLCSDMAAGVEYLHNNDIVHGDLKGANILINSCGRAVLGDFGLASVDDPEILKWTAQSTVASKGGTTRWQAPELHETEDKVDKIYNTKESDIFAWANVCYEIFTGRLPFYEVTRESTVLIKVLRGDIPTHPQQDDPAWLEHGLNERIWDLMENCWKFQPSERPKMATIITRINAEKPYDARPPVEWGGTDAMHFRNAQDRDLLEDLFPVWEEQEAILSQFMHKSEDFDT
ncbi:Serine/threonine-protein kinase A-Raf [Termitomyces sp. T112]|nr:Serine/threonine-protein kinase A-Raf [Termitomyces sp. T112]